MILSDMFCSYEKQLIWKEKKVRDCLQRIGGFAEIPMEPIMGMDKPYHYRNKAQFPVGYDKEGNLVRIVCCTYSFHHTKHRLCHSASV